MENSLLWKAVAYLCAKQIRSTIVFMCSFYLFMYSFHSVMRSFHLVMHSFHLVMCSFHSVIRSFHSIIRYFYALFLCALFMRSFYMLFLCAVFMRSFYVIFLYAFLMCSFHKCQVILHMHKKYYCTKTNMADNKMNDVLKKLGPFDHRAKFVEEKISTDIQSAIFKPLSYCFEETIGFDSKASSASRPVSLLIS